MIIRSQDKKKLFNLEQIRKIDCETNSVMADDVSVIGTYSTEEKAIKVLDMIQQEFCDYGETGVFNMPSDEEVEV